MQKLLIADNSERDTQRLIDLLKESGLSITVCSSAAEVTSRLNGEADDWAAIMLLWELPGPPFGAELVARFRHLLPDVPIVVLSDALDATLATRAFALGARDFLQKPLDPQRVRSCLDTVLQEGESNSPIVAKLKERILGESPALLSTLKQLAKVIQHLAPRVLLIGESGTGKELFAQAIHELGSQPKAPFVAVNVAAIPKGLIESALFGHEKGAFTGATDLHRGYMEEAGAGTLFLDELGELDVSLQTKLLRAIQEKKFRRLNGNKEISFQARLVCATNRDLALDVKQGSFRQDLFHRIAEITINIPPLRNRTDDVDFLLEHFLKLHGGDRRLRFARETLLILRSYPFPGNVRELENIVKTALIDSEGDLILPQHLPLSTMGVFLGHDDNSRGIWNEYGLANTTPLGDYNDLFREISATLPKNWEELPYKEVFDQYQRAFDRIYLRELIERHRHNVTRATKAAGVDKKTFAQHWKASGLPPLRSEDKEQNE